jgi:hypothetical protein
MHAHTFAHTRTHKHTYIWRICIGTNIVRSVAEIFVSAVVKSAFAGSGNTIAISRVAVRCVCQVHILQNMLIKRKFISKHESNLKITWKVFEQLPFYAAREHAKKYATRKNLTKLVLHWRHLRGNCWFVLHRRGAGLLDQYELQQSCCMHIRIRKLWFTHSARLIIKQEWILRTGNLGRAWWRVRPRIHLVSSEACFF